MRPGSFRGTGRKRERERERMSLSDWHLAVKLADQPLATKSILRLPETELGEYSLGGYSISFLKQLIAGKLQESVPDPELIDLIYCGRKLKDDQTLDFYGIQPGSTVHVLRKSWPEPDQKPEPVDKVAALREFRVLHTALHSSSSYREAVSLMNMITAKGSAYGFSWASFLESSTPSSRPASLGYSGAAGPRPITQSELATALALTSTAESSSHTPTPGTQSHSLGTSPLSSGVQSGTPITNDLFSQALQHALQASGQPSLQSQWQPQLQQLRDMGIQDDELSLRALQATGGDIQAALELIFAGGAP
ncbi:PREDICTED: ubiquitin-like protein 7 [Myotis brandtii]|uniref:ubiquitin-like protein 7 n=1 Tax=Myotis brandtii TaxID=109478 RepID=UPI000704345D|nr:PREDICTED: ubiquitin-like protein 7 [Myotis brandtii]